MAAGRGPRLGDPAGDAADAGREIKSLGVPVSYSQCLGLAAGWHGCPLPLPAGSLRLPAA